MTITESESEVTHEINYRTCNTVSFRRPPAPRKKPAGLLARHRRESLRKTPRRALLAARRVLRAVVLRWDDVWPVLVGVVAGVGIAVGLIVCAYLAWVGSMR